MELNDIKLDEDDSIIHNHGKAHNIIWLSLVMAIQRLHSLVFGLWETATNNKIYPICNLLLQTFSVQMPTDKAIAIVTRHTFWIFFIISIPNFVAVFFFCFRSLAFVGVTCDVKFNKFTYLSCRQHFTLMHCDRLRTQYTVLV